MNFLAHTLLAGDAASDRIGGLLGDFVKGLLPAGLPPDLAAGVALHRAIDSFADRHTAFIASRARISPLRRGVGGVHPCILASLPTHKAIPRASWQPCQPQACRMR